MSLKARRIIFWIMQTILLIVFLGEGSTKLLGLQFQIEAFMRWGYPTWLRFVIGTLEIAGAIGLLTKLRTWTTLGLFGIMLGAIYTHLTHHEAPVIAFPIFMIILLILSTRLKKKMDSPVTPAK